MGERDQALGGEVGKRGRAVGRGDGAELGRRSPVDGDDDALTVPSPPDGVRRVGSQVPDAEFVHSAECTCVYTLPIARIDFARQTSAMNFAFSEEQDELRKTVRAFLDAKSDEAAVRVQMDTEQGYDKAVWSQMAGELGLTGLVIPEEFGGSGYSWVELGVVLEEMGRSLVCAPFFSSAVLAAHTLLLSGDEHQKAAHLPGIASGLTLATLAFTEPSGKWDEAGITMPATGSGTDYKLNGTKMFVLDGHIADDIFVAARTAAGVSLFHVQGDAAGLTRTALSTMDQTRKQAKLEFNDVSATLVGTDGDGWNVLSRVLDLAAVALAAEQVGGAQKVLDMAVEYAKVRVQFGRPIGSFQAIKHKCADMLLEVESAKSAAYYAMWCASEMNEELPSVASLAKAYCSEAYFHAASENIQIHGGIGFTWEHPAHLYFKRAKSSELLFGDPTYHRELLAQRIGL
jgi:alkylation response protein AidB-like acyl-CoA dehydrogenase